MEGLGGVGMWGVVEQACKGKQDECRRTWVAKRGGQGQVNRSAKHWPPVTPSENSSSSPPGAGDQAPLPPDRKGSAAPVQEALPVLHPSRTVAIVGSVPHHRLRRPRHGRHQDTNGGSAQHLHGPVVGK
jgi:hypothetical protein